MTIVKILVVSLMFSISIPGQVPKTCLGNDNTIRIQALAHHHETGRSNQTILQPDAISRMQLAVIPYEKGDFLITWSSGDYSFKISVLGLLSGFHHHPSGMLEYKFKPLTCKVAGLEQAIKRFELFKDKPIYLQ